MILTPNLLFKALVFKNWKLFNIYMFSQILVHQNIFNSGINFTPTPIPHFFIFKNINIFIFTWTTQTFLLPSPFSPSLISKIGRNHRLPYWQPMYFPAPGSEAKKFAQISVSENGRQEEASSIMKTIIMRSIWARHQNLTCSRLPTPPPLAGDRRREALD